MSIATDLSACCRVSYGHPLARALLGDSLHPGGLELTAGLAAHMGVTESSAVLDVGSGFGATAVHLASTLGCTVTAVTLEENGVAVGGELAQREGVEDRVSWHCGDIQDIDLRDKRFDFVLMECVLSILTLKQEALGRLHGILRPGGGLGLTDVTVSAPLPPQLKGLLATAGCVGGALSLEGYRDLLERQGFIVERSEDCPAVAAAFLRDIKGKLLLAEIARAVGRLPVGKETLDEARRLLDSLEEQARQGVLGYGLVVARKPA